MPRPVSSRLSSAEIIPTHARSPRPKLPPRFIPLALTHRPHSGLTAVAWIGRFWQAPGRAGIPLASAVRDESRPDIPNPNTAWTRRFDSVESRAPSGQSTFDSNWKRILLMKRRLQNDTTPGRYSWPTAAIVFCLLAYLTCATALAAGPKRVLLLHPSSGANLLSAMKIRTELERQSPEPLEVYDASLVTGRPIDEIVADRYGDYLRSIFLDQNLDLAVVVGGASLRLYDRYRAQLFPSAPCWQLRKSGGFLLPSFPAMKPRLRPKSTLLR